MIVITCRVAQYHRFTIFAMLCSATAAAARLKKFSSRWIYWCFLMVIRLLKSFTAVHMRSKNISCTPICMVECNKSLLFSELPWNLGIFVQTMTENLTKLPKFWKCWAQFFKLRLFQHKLELSIKCRSFMTNFLGLQKRSSQSKRLDFIKIMFYSEKK